MIAPITDQAPAGMASPPSSIAARARACTADQYGEMDSDLTLNFFVLAVDEALRGPGLDGLIETAPGFRSILVSYDPAALDRRDACSTLLGRCTTSCPRSSEIKIPSRRVHLPLAFDDSQSRERGGALHAHDPQGRAELRGRQQHRLHRPLQRARRPRGALRAGSRHRAVDGVHRLLPGLPFMFPLDPRDTVFVPKYNPTRTWTAEGARRASAARAVAIYPVESAGRLPALRPHAPDLRPPAQRNAAFRDNPLLLRPATGCSSTGSRRTSSSAFEDVQADATATEIEDSPFDVGAYLEWLPTVADEAAERRRAAEAPRPRRFPEAAVP